MGKFTRKCPLCKTNFRNENIFHSAIVENLVYAYRRCVKSFQEIENHRIFIKKLESVQNQTVRLSEISRLSNASRSRADSAPYSNLPPPHTQFNSSTNNSIDETNCSKCSNRFSQDPCSIAFPRSASSQYRMPQLNEYFLPDEPTKVPHELPHIESPHVSLLSESERTPTPSPTGDTTTLPSFLDRNNTNLKSSHLLKPLDTIRPDKVINLTPPPSTTSSNNNNKCRGRGYSDITNDPFLVPSSIDFHSSDDNNNNYKHKGKEMVKGSSSSFTLTPVELVSTPIENETTNATNTNISNTNSNINRKSKLKMYSTPPISPEREKKLNTFNEKLLPPTTTTATTDKNSDKDSFTSSPEYTSRKLTDDDKEDTYVVTTSTLSPVVNKDKRSLQLDSNLIESSLVNDNNSQNHFIIGSPVCSHSKKDQELKSINSIVLDGDDENAKVVTSIDSILDGIPNASESMICHNGTTRNNSDNDNFLE